MSTVEVPAGWTLDVAGAQIQGQRADQEDAWQVDRYGDFECLASLADGLGGHPAGDVASRVGVEQFQLRVGELRKAGEESAAKWLERGAVHADEVLREMQRLQPALEGMATTMVGAYVNGRELSLVAVGDSYALLLRGEQLSRLNELHTEGGGVTSCVGFNLARIDIADKLLLLPGDRLLLASDGIVTLDEDEIRAMLRDSPSAKVAVERLLASVEAAQLPYQDNTTVVALFF